MPSKATPDHYQHTRVEKCYLSAKIDFVIVLFSMSLILLFINVFNVSVMSAFSYVFRHCNRLLIDKFLVFFVSLFFLLGIYFFRRFKDLYQFNQDVAKHAYFDDVTQLPNRVLVYDYINKCIKNNKIGNNLVIAFIDFDRFKIINDTYGHHFGDELLQQVGCRLNNVLQEGEMIARLGGDEFLFVSSYQDDCDIPNLIERLKSTRNQAFSIQNTTITLKYSIGVALYPDNGDSVEALIRSADVAMYHAKLQGKTSCMASHSGIEEFITQ